MNCSFFYHNSDNKKTGAYGLPNYLQFIHIFRREKRTMLGYYEKKKSLEGITHETEKSDS